MKIHHICIQTADYQKSLTFYQKVLAFELVQESLDFHSRDYNTWLELDGFMIELQTAKEGNPFGAYEKDREGIPHFCLYSQDFDKDYERIRRSGLAIFRQKNSEDIYRVENGRLFKLVAPEGTIIEVRDSVEL